MADVLEGDDMNEEINTDASQISDALQRIVDGRLNGVVSADPSQPTIETITVRPGKWHRSEFPHPLVTLDFDANGNLLAVSAPSGFDALT